MTFGQLHRTVILLAACLIAVALASAWALSSSRPPDARPVIVQVITYRQEATRFDERWGELLKQLLSPATRPSEPVQMALADVRPREAGLPREHLELVREQITAAVAVPLHAAALTRRGKPSEVSSQPRDPVCGSKGRRYYKKGRGMAWRCIR